MLITRPLLSRPYAGSACGHTVELHPPERELLGLFYARFQEERSRVQNAAAKSSGGENVQLSASTAPASP